MFDYLYYRLYHYYKWCYNYFGHKGRDWKDEDYCYSTDMALTTWQTGLVFCIVMTLRTLIPLETLFGSFLFVLLLVFGTGIFFLVYNKKHFKGKIPMLEIKFKGIHINKWLKTWLFAILFFSSILFFMLFPFLLSHLIELVVVGE